MGQKRASESRLWYRQIEVDSTYIYNKDIDCSIIRWIFKARTELIYLNNYKMNQVCKKCSLCNRNEIEDVFHFVAVCPILKEFRVGYLGKILLSQREFLDYLTDSSRYPKLAKFCKYAWPYRYELIKEFNFTWYLGCVSWSFAPLSTSICNYQLVFLFLMFNFNSNLSSFSNFFSYSVIFFFVIFV